MKKTKTSKRKAGAKNLRGVKSIEGYLATVPEAARSNFGKLRTAVLSVVSRGAVETISYGIPAILCGKVAVWYAAFARHCSLFPTGAVIDAFRSELKGYVTSKGTIQFPIDKPLPVALVKKIVKARLARLEAEGR